MEICDLTQNESVFSDSSQQGALALLLVHGAHRVSSSFFEWAPLDLFLHLLLYRVCFVGVPLKLWQEMTFWHVFDQD